MPESPSYDVFVSYAEADRAWVEGYLLAALEQAGVRCMYESAFALGVPRLLEFERSIQQSKRTLLVISPNYLADGLNEFITTLGQSYGQDTNTWPVIPLIRQSVPLPPRLGMLVGLKATNEKEQESAIAQLCADLKRPLPTSAPPPDCPYPGMKPFGLGDRDRFFGREEEVNQLLEHLRLHPFITVIGPSGSGKSSLVFAGLIPALRESRLFGSGGWRMQSMRPGVTPQTTLKQQLASGAQQKAARMLLIVDQFEELFTLAKEEAIPFQESLLKLVKTPNVYLALTVRADFYGDLMTSLLWQEIQNYRLEVVPLKEAGLRQAILKPAETVGVFVEPALVERLIADAAREPGVLPLIQETLVLLWQRLERRFLPLRAYEAIVLPRTAYEGQGTEQKTGLQVAISRRADQAIKDLKDDPEKQQAISRRIFLRLIQFGEGRANTRRQQTVEALRAVGDDIQLFQETLLHLVNCRLLTLSGDNEETGTSRKVDISHEALITGWPTLQEWIEARKDAEQTRRRIAASAEAWVRLGRGSGGLLDRIELAEAQRWLDSPDAAELGYATELVDLIDASKRQITLKRVTRIGAGLLIVGVIIGASGYGFWQQEKALIASYDNWSDFVQPDTLSSEKLKTSLDFLNKMNRRVKKYEDQGDINRALAYYRQIRTDSSRLLESYSNTPIGEKEGSGRKQVEELWEESEQSMHRLIREYRLPNLKKDLEAVKNNQFGELLNGVYVKSNLEKQFTDGSPLQRTYMILMTDIGARADLNNNGQIDNKIEADQIPCETLNEIQMLWIEATKKKACNLNENSGCPVLGGHSLTSRLIAPPPSFALERFHKCLKNDFKF